MNWKIAEIQKVIGTQPDGIWGPKSQAALLALLAAPVVVDTNLEPIPSADRVDNRSEAAIATLHRLVQPKARALVNLAKQNGITVEITSGTRTYAEQDALFAKGGVTKARGGQSNHNFGLAMDLTIFDGPRPVWESPKYKTLGALGKRLGLTWGGDWRGFVDEPHMELHPPWAAGMSESQMLAELRRRHDNGIDAFA